MTAKKVQQEAGSAEARETTYAKSQLAASARFADSRDILNAVLSDKKRYSISETDRAIAEFMKGMVK